MFEHGEAIVDDILDRGEMPANHANPSEGGFDWAPADSPVVTTPSFYILGLSLSLSLPLGRKRLLDCLSRASLTLLIRHSLTP